jgi:uncharacterized repeat protein (TIGR02543 family)
LASAQNSQFAFDANGNLLAQTTETSAPPQILGQPQDQVVVPGEPTSFSVVAADTRGLGYQWFFNGTIVPGATADALLILSANATNEGLYSVVLGNSSGSVTSSPAHLFLDTDADHMADSWELTYFSNLNQNAVGDFDGDGASNLDEFLHGLNPTNRASAIFQLTVLADGAVVSIAPDLLAYTNGQIVTLTVTELPGDHFQGWTGDALGTNNPLTLVMTNNRTVFAHFQAYEIVWTNLAGGNWHEPLNWLPNLVPDADDVVWITNSVTVTVSGDAHCGNLTFGSPAAPTLTGAGALTIHGNAVWAQGLMSGTGRTIIAPGGRLTLTYALGLSLNTRTLENGGTVILSGAGGISLNNAVITNRPGALLRAQNSAPLSSGGAARLDNAGTFRRTGSGSTSARIPFNNYGSVEIQTGTLSLFNGGSSSGDFNVPSGTTLDFAGGTFTANASSSITGAGQLSVSAGTANLGGFVNVTGTNSFNSLAANLTGNYICTNNTLVISAGVATFSGTGLVTPATLILSSGALSGSNNITVLNQMTWSGGAMNGSGGARTIIPPGVTININAVGGVSMTTRTLDNEGTILWTGVGGINLSGAVITNRPSALFQAQNAATLSGDAAARFDNAGTFRKISGGATTFTASFKNYGATEIQSGTLSPNGGGLNSGTIEAADGTALVFAGSTLSVAFTASAASRMTGAGRLTVSGGTANLAGLVNLSGTNTFSGTANLTGNYICTNNALIISGGSANFSGTGLMTPGTVTLSSGVLSGSSSITVLNQMAWTGGAMNGTNGARTIIPAGATLTINSPSSVPMTRRILDNEGTVVWSGAGGITLSSAVMTNRPGALFQVQNATAFNFGGGANRLDNAGTFRKTSSGTTTFSSGVSLNNYGAVEIGRGILQANGGYTSRTNALLNCALGGTTAGTGFGQLQVAGTVNLNGSLSVDLINGFVPVTNAAFAVVTAGTRAGTFGNFSYPSNDVTMQMSNTPTSVIVRVTDVAPARPLLLQPELMGSTVRLTWTANSNATYRLEFKGDLNATNWDSLPGDVIGAGNTAIKMDELTTSNRFYRIRVVP